MIDLVEVKKAVNNKIIASKPLIPIIAGEVKEGFQRPSLFTYVRPLYVRDTHMNYVDCTLAITIVYYPNKQNDIEELEIKQTLLEAFKLSLDVSGQSFLISEKVIDDLEEAWQMRFFIRSRLVYGNRKEAETIMHGLTINLDFE